MTESKTLLIGLDGTSYDLVKSWVSKGRLPTFRRLMKKGVYGKLKSTMPPHSAMAWVSAFTGKNAGKHGIFYFTDLKEPNLRIISSRDLKSEMVWNILSDNDKRVMVMNAPFTYPVEKIKNGTMIAGFTTPFVDIKNREITFPKELKEELLRINYEIDLSTEEFVALIYKDKKNLLPRFSEIEDKRVELAKHLMKNYEWDSFILILTILDRIQHTFLGYMDPKNPAYNSENAEKYGDYVFRSYKKVDKILETIVNSIDENTNLIIISDHGFRSIHKYFYVNNWLSQHNLLKVKKNLFKIILTPLAFHEKFLKKIFTVFGKQAAKLGFKMFNLNLAMQGLAIASSVDIDFSETRLFSPANYGVLRINVKGRDPMGIVDPQIEYKRLREFLIKLLYKLTDPETGERIVKKVYRKEELYWGSYVEDGPDIVFETYDKYFPSANILPFQGFLQPAKERENANHADNGFIALFGPGIKRNKEIYESHIMDITSTILYLHGCPIPKDMDGQVLTQAFTKAFLEKHPITHEEETPTQLPKEKSQYLYSKEEEEEIRARLKALGYI